MTLPRLLASFLLVPAALTTAAEQPARDARKIYAEFCASCHGANMEGGSAPSLVSGQWRYGGDDAALSTSIRNGRPQNGMPGFGATVSEKEIRGLVVFINEQAGQASSRRTPAPSPSADTVATGKLHSFRVETVVSGLREPYAIAFQPDGLVLITEKRGTLRVVEKGVLRPEPVSGLPAVDSGGQGGLFDVVLHPDFARNGWIYLAFSDQLKTEPNRGAVMTTLIRGRLKGNTWTDQQIIFRAPEETFRHGGNHFGGRLAFDKNNFLFFSIGERGNQVDAQNLTLPNGKIHRLHDDGRVPVDNPFLKTPGAIPSIWSYGHRNPQGLRFHPVTGELWEHEHGPRGGDELNIIQRGLNYGWPLATFGMNYNGTPITDVTARPDIQPPITYWLPSIAPCGLAIYTGDRFPKWKNQLFVSSLAAQELRRLEVKDGKVIDQEIIFKGLGRLRDVANGPDGLLYVLLQDRVARLAPAAE
ncbi:PQQ-dependent sugar dehydrogenase [Rariglobus hedericola]|nr:PQQ-dependent sugar dehydrogenase [Rariglobus hedericola]